MSIILQDSNLLWWLSLILRGWGWCQGPLFSLRTRVTSLHAGQGAAPCLTLLSAPQPGDTWLTPATWRCSHYHPSSLHTSLTKLLSLSFYFSNLFLLLSPSLSLPPPLTLSFSLSPSHFFFLSRSFLIFYQKCFCAKCSSQSR